MLKEITPRYYTKLCKAFEQWQLGGKQSEMICFHLSELANFSPKYKELLDEIMKQKTKEKFLEKLEEFHGAIINKHEVEYHLIPADKLLTSWFQKLEVL